MSRFGSRRNPATLRRFSGAVASSGVLDPATLVDLEGWYRADELVTSGSAVTTWTDKQGNIGDATQATGARQPTLASAPTGFGGQDAVLFDGSDDLLQVASFSPALGDPLTCYAMVRAAAFGTTRRIFDFGVGQFSLATTVTPNWLVQQSSLFSGGTPATATTYACCVVFDGASSALYVDDFASALLTGSTGSTTRTQLAIGAHNTPGNYWSGHIAELLFCSTSHDADTRASVLEYLTDRYSL